MIYPVFWLAARDRLRPTRIRSSEVGPPFFMPFACIRDSCPLTIFLASVSAMRLTVFVSIMNSYETDTVTVPTLVVPTK